MSIDAKTLLAEAETLRPALLTDRRTLHRNPEAGPVLPHTAAYVKQRLTELGYAPRDMAGGVTADITGTDTGRCVRCGFGRPPDWNFSPKTAPCTPAAMICTRPCS